MPYFTYAPNISEFIQWTGGNLEEIVEFCDPGFQFVDNGDGSFLLNGWRTIPLNSFISKEANVIQPSEMHFYQEVPDGARREFVLDIHEES